MPTNQYLCCDCGDELTADLTGNPNPTCCHKCAEIYAKQAHKEMDAVRSSVNYSEPADSLQGCRESDRIAEGLDAAGKPVHTIINLTPQGLKTPEGIKCVNDALDEWNGSAHAVANAVDEFLQDYSTFLTQDVLRHAGVTEAIHQLTALVGARNRKQEVFLRAIAGERPSKPFLKTYPVTRNGKTVQVTIPED